MDPLAAELMEWGDPALEDQEILDRETRSAERRFPDSPTGWIPLQFQGTTPVASERARRLRRALAATPKGDPRRRISP